jgi:hypothetical protein
MCPFCLCKKKGRGKSLPFVLEPELRVGKLSTGARQRVHPTLHPRLGVLNILFVEPFFEIYFSDRINGPHEIALVTERNCGIDAHAALKHGI